MYDKWNLEVLYKGYDDEEFKKDLDRIDEINKKINALSETVGEKDTKEAVTEILKTQEEYSTVLSKLYNYCSLNQSVNTSDTDSVSYAGQIIQKSNESTKAQTKLDKYLAGIENLDEIIKDDEFLREYEDYLHQIQAHDKYSLSPDVEEALASMDLSGGQAWSDLQGFLTSSVQVDYNGEKTTLADIRNLAYSPDAAVRKAAYEAELASYDKIKDAVAYALNSIKMQDITECRLRGHKSPLDKVLFNSRMQPSTLEALLEAMKEYMPRFHEYLRAKGKALGHSNGLPWYDMFAPMGSNSEKYTVEEAKKYLINVFGTFNPRMAEIIDRAFEENWIDFFPRKGKVGGAFCADISSAKEFRILTNFSGSFNDIVTLAHELGHGYHDFMIHDNRPLNTSYTMPVAETASTFNENVVTSYAIDHAKNDEEKLALIEGQLCDVTQIMCDIYSRFLFESKVVENRNNSFMFPDELCRIMLDAQKQAYGDGLDQETLHPYMWVCKSHYYQASLGFYNFPYAFGGLFARGLYAKYKEEGSAFLEKYNEMLKKTPVTSVEDAAKICGIDLTTKDFWLMSLHSYDKTIDEFKRLVG